MFVKKRESLWTGYIKNLAISEKKEKKRQIKVKEKLFKSKSFENSSKRKLFIQSILISESRRSERVSPCPVVPELFFSSSRF